MEIIFHSDANKTHFHEKGCAPSLIFKVTVFGTQKWPIKPTSSREHKHANYANDIDANDSAHARSHAERALRSESKPFVVTQPKYLGPVI